MITRDIKESMFVSDMKLRLKWYRTSTGPAKMLVGRRIKLLFDNETLDGEVWSTWSYTDFDGIRYEVLDISSEYGMGGCNLTEIQLSKLIATGMVSLDNLKMVLDGIHPRWLRIMCAKAPH